MCTHYGYTTSVWYLRFKLQVAVQRKQSQGKGCITVDFERAMVESVQKNN